MVLRRRGDSSDMKATTSKKMKNMKKVEQTLTVMDGLVRREVSFFLVPEEETNTTQIRASPTKESGEKMQAYVVGGRDVLRTWERNHSPVVIFVPNEKGWRSKDMRVIADEISFNNQAIVVVPDIRVDEDASDSISKLTTSSGTRKKRTVLTNELLDRIVAVVRYAKVQYDSNAVSIAGIGVGGGVALEAVAELSTIAFFYRLYRGQEAPGTNQEERKLEFITGENSARLTDEELAASAKQVGAAVIIGTDGLEEVLESDLLGENIGATEVEAFLGLESSEIASAGEYLLIYI